MAMKNPSVHTKLFFLLGYPLEHTFSPRMQNRAFDSLGMDCSYWPVEVSAEDLPVVFGGLKRMNTAGFNVTIPHKLRIMNLLDEIDPLAAAIGAVNTICMRDGKAVGYNTDGEGFVRNLEEGLGVTPAGKTVMLLGSGGAARAIAMTLASRGARKVFICNRTRGTAEALAAEINGKIGNCAEAIPMETAFMAGVIPGCDILVNCTSVGMHPDTDATPIDPGLLFRDIIVADIVYNPRMTRLLSAARDAGCRYINGLGMLVYQGAEAFRLWTGVMPPVDAMFDATGRA